MRTEKEIRQRIKNFTILIEIYETWLENKQEFGDHNRLTDKRDIERVERIKEWLEWVLEEPSPLAPKGRKYPKARGNSDGVASQKGDAENRHVNESASR